MGGQGQSRLAATGFGARNARSSVRSRKAARGVAGQPHVYGKLVATCVPFRRFP